ncbi:hypothetical protein NE237_017016 [Protea cynaroides]|uniref:Uncharacterized protein n=1 Tax=Protea cynaroides TaxID=273540 RepID=A0A9Q0K780_9MAGN|nr:hypothetical protein NE237_017016 [Protea cynaroides]
MKMGICISTQSAKERGKLVKESTAVVILEDGKLEELKERRKAGDLISENPNCFLCNADSMYPDSCIPPLSDKEELQFGQIYFLLPLSKKNIPVSFSDLCTLAVKASIGLSKQDLQMQASPFSSRRIFSLLVASRKDRKNSADSDIRHRRTRIQVEPYDPETQ